MGIHGLLVPLKAFGYAMTIINISSILSAAFMKEIFLYYALFMQIYS